MGEIAAMPVNTERLRREVLTLPLAERAALIDDLLSSIDQPDPVIDELWAEEARQRSAAYKSGRMEGIDAEAVFAELDDL